MLHPREMVPESGELSSTTNKFQVPFGSVPLNCESDAGALELPAGAGLGISKDNVGNCRVGLNVPEVNAELMGNELAARSSSVSVKSVTGNLVSPPTSLISMDNCPPGPANTTFRSLGNECVNPSSVMDKWLMVWKSRPLTEMDEGYKLPVDGGAPESLMVIVLVLEKV